MKKRGKRRKKTLSWLEPIYSHR